MKTVKLTREPPSLMELLALASEDNLILITGEGQEFVLAEIGDLDDEIELVRQNKDLMGFLAQRSYDTKKYTLRQVREKLDLE